MKLFKYSINCKSGRKFNVTSRNMERAKELVAIHICNGDTINTVKCLGRADVPKGNHDHIRKPYVNRNKVIKHMHVHTDPNIFRNHYATHGSYY